MEWWEVAGESIAKLGAACEESYILCTVTATTTETTISSSEYHWPMPTRARISYLMLGLRKPDCMKAISRIESESGRKVGEEALPVCAVARRACAPQRLRQQKINRSVALTREPALTCLHCGGLTAQRDLSAPTLRAEDPRRHPHRYTRRMKYARLPDVMIVWRRSSSRSPSQTRPVWLTWHRTEA